MKIAGTVMLVLALIGAVIFLRREPELRAHPILSEGMLLKEPNPVGVPLRLRVLSRLRRGDAERSFAIRQWQQWWLKFETTNETTIRSVVDAMRKTARDEVPRNGPPTNVVTYHMYFDLSDSKLPVYYKFYYKGETDEPSSLSAYSTVGNLWNAEGLEGWFVTNSLLPTPK